MTDKNTVFQQNKTLNIRGSLMDLSTPKVMGILNLTPDSFYDGGNYNQCDTALLQVGQMLEEGADFIDIGAYSSRPGAADISIDEEKERLVPVIKMIIKQFPHAILSIDTFRAEVARAALESGAHIINDISAGELDAQMFSTVAEYRVPYIMMHMKGTPKTMQQHATYSDVFNEVLDYFIQKVNVLKDLGVNDLIIDPGFGFAKTTNNNYTLLTRLDEFKILGLPLLAGLSRKSMIWKTLGTSANEALNGTTVLNTIALMKGASILRVHDIKPAVEAIKLVSQLHGL
ncbi:MAG TPA: dihydropteroate synthase [Sphingobacteriaceae bacterium]|nr:dihydropteroate synthase [Sphingobacteriaceae bacterium]